MTTKADVYAMFYKKIPEFKVPQVTTVDELAKLLKPYPLKRGRGQRVKLPEANSMPVLRSEKSNTSNKAE